MSTLKVNALQDTSGNGFYPARAWVNFNGTGTVAIREDGNTSSITDDGTGLYTVTFSNSLTDANYAVGQGGSQNASYPTSSANAMSVRYDTAPTSSNFKCTTGHVGTSGGIARDLAAVHFSVTR
jgi:hypothetical protein